jgi:hypothetical protein
MQPGSAAYDPAIARKLEPVLGALLGELDAYVGALRAALGQEDLLAVVGDHGLAPARWDFFPNVVLRRAGLLVLDARGQIDLTRTKVMYALGDGGYLQVNSDARPGGIVPASEHLAVLRQARAALSRMAVKTPGGVVPLVRQFVMPGDRLWQELGLAGLGATDRAYLALQPGYVPSVVFIGEEAYRARPRNATGAYGDDPRDPALQGFLFAAGPGLPAGQEVGAARLIDVAPTLARWLGLPAGPGAVAGSAGRALWPAEHDGGAPHGAPARLPTERHKAK